MELQHTLSVHQSFQKFLPCSDWYSSNSNCLVDIQNPSEHLHCYISKIQRSTESTDDAAKQIISKKYIKNKQVDSERDADTSEKTAHNFLQHKHFER